MVKSSRLLRPLQQKKPSKKKSKQETDNKPNMDLWPQLQLVFNIMNHGFIIVVAVYMAAVGKILNFQGTAFHAFMTTIGFHVLMAEAVMCHYPLNILTYKYPHRVKSRIHGVLQALGGTIALMGALSKFASTDGLHFSTWHGKIGIAATSMCVASLIGGTVNFVQPKLPFLSRYITAAELKYRHNLFGMLTFTLGMLAIVLGYQTKFFEKYVDPNFIIPMTLTTITVYCFTLVGPLESFIYKTQHRRPRN